MKIREKRRLLRLLRDEEPEAIMSELRRLQPRRAVNSLFAGLSHHNEKIRWHAVTAMGPVVAALADSDREAARVVMRRLMWSLNDESGGIGWGAPEAMGEIMARHRGLAREYAHILVAYMREDGFYLELPELQRGLMWGLARLAGVRPRLLRDRNAVRYLLPYLESSDATVRGTAAWALGLLSACEAAERLKALTGDNRRLRLYQGERLVTVTVAGLASDALTVCEPVCPPPGPSNLKTLRKRSQAPHLRTICLCVARGQVGPFPYTGYAAPVRLSKSVTPWRDDRLPARW